MALQLEPAHATDLAAVVTLMNAAFRGAGSQASWSTEAAYITGDRTTEALLQEEIARKPQAFLLLMRADKALGGCVWLEPVSSQAWYLGSLTVDPSLQNTGLGRRLLSAAELWATERGAKTIQMTVVHLRSALIAWYVRRGYVLTGETRPFPYQDARFGVPLRDGLFFVVLEKTVSLPATEQ